MMNASKIGHQKWAIAIYLITIGLQGIASMNLHTVLDMTQNSAWHIAYRIRKAWCDVCKVFYNRVDVDEAYIGGKESDKHASKKLHAWRGTVGNTAVVGIKDREANQVNAEVIQHTIGKPYKVLLPKTPLMKQKRILGFLENILSLNIQ